MMVFLSLPENHPTHNGLVQRGPITPFEGVKTRWKKPQKPKRFVPTQEQFQAIVADIRAQKYNAEAEDSADFVEFLGSAGLGQAEASSLTWGDVDWTLNYLHIKRHKTQARFQVPIYEWLKPLLARLEKSHASHFHPNSLSPAVHSLI